VRETKFPRSLFLSEDGRIVRHLDHGERLPDADREVLLVALSNMSSHEVRTCRIERDAAGRISRLACCKTPKTAVFLDDLTSDLFKHKRRR
jgi:hypothetical protein